MHNINNPRIKVKGKFSGAIRALIQKK